MATFSLCLLRYLRKEWVDFVHIWYINHGWVQLNQTDPIKITPPPPQIQLQFPQNVQLNYNYTSDILITVASVWILNFDILYCGVCHAKEWYLCLRWFHSFTKMYRGSSE